MYKYLIFAIWLWLGFWFTTIGQDNNLIQNYSNQSNFRVEYSIINEIETGLATGDVSKISRYFGEKPYLSFSSGVSGYYSANQAYYVLEDFFKMYRVVSFKFESKKIEESLSYATGVYYYERKGKRDSSLVYVTLNKVGKNWFITQISIN